MKNLRKIIGVAVILLLAFTVNAQQKKSKNEEIKIKTSTVCNMCKYNVEKAMAYEKGVKKANLDVKSQILTVSYNPTKTSPEKIKKTITLTGYDADDIPADQKAYDRLDPCCKKEKGIH